MTNKLSVVVMAGAGLFLVAAEKSAPPAVFTAAQAEAGRVASHDTCVLCHTDTLLGRTGAADERPLVSSLTAPMQKIIQDAGGKVPPLIGPEFVANWSSRTTKQLSNRIQEAAGGFKPKNYSATTCLDLTAYFLQASGAQPGQQPLTVDTAVEISAIFPTIAPMPAKNTPAPTPAASSSIPIKKT